MKPARLRASARSAASAYSYGLTIPLGVTRLYCGKAQAHVIDRPASVAEKNRARAILDLGLHGRALGRRHQREEAFGESLQPIAERAWQRRGPWGQGDGPHHEAAFFEPRAIVVDGREIPRDRRPAADAAARQRREYRGEDLGDITGATAFCDETAAGLQRAPDAIDHQIRRTHPMQRSVREDRVEFRRERQISAIN